MTTEMMEKPEFKKIEEKANALQVKADAIEIVDDESRRQAGEFLIEINTQLKVFQPIIDEPWRIAKDAKDRVQKWRDGLLARFMGPKQVTASKIGDYDMRIAEKRRKEAAALEEKARKQAQDARDAEIAAAKAAKDKEAVKALKEAPLFVQPAAPKTQAPSKVEGVSTRFEWKLDVIFNPSALPREFLMPDEKIIKARIKAMGSAHGIPGVRAVQVPIVSGRV